MGMPVGNVWVVRIAAVSEWLRKITAGRRRQ